MQQTLHYQVARIYKLGTMNDELFQSAWSGATYNIEGDKLEVEDKTIYMINDYGQLQAINKKDLSGLGYTVRNERN